MDLALRRSIFLLGLTLLFCCPSYVVAEPLKCETQDACHCVLSNGSTIALDELVSEKQPRFIYTDEKNVTVSFNPCQPFTRDEDCKDAAACLQEYGPTGHESDRIIAKQDKVQWKWTGDAGDKPSLVYTFENHDFTVMLECDKDGSPGNSAFSLPNNTKYDAITATLKSKCACVGGCIHTEPTTPTASTTEKPQEKTSGLSTGSILVIVFVVLVLVYLVGGVIVNKMVNGATGLELIPNIEFWRGFLRLVLDGVAFSLNCCRSRQSSPSYDNV